MEAFGAVSGAVGVLSAFKACVDVFEYIQVGRQFGRDYQTCQLRIALLHVRLTRWGEAIQLSAAPLLAGLNATAEQMDVAGKTLVQIRVLLEDSSKISKDHGKDSGVAVQTSDDAVDTFTTKAVTNKMRKLARKRRKEAGVGKLMTWAIHDRKELTALIEDVSALMDQLENLFPIADILKDMARKETAQVGSEKEVKVLANASRDIDTALHAATLGHMYTDVEIHVGDGSKVLQGNIMSKDFVGPVPSMTRNVYEGFRIVGGRGSSIMLGDRYGGRDFLSS